MSYLRRSAIWGSFAAVGCYVFEWITVEEAIMALLFWVVMAVCGSDKK
ncbi:hypothetical protein [Listeria booriae]|uniref:Lipoprotein n=1 Tax=Listeria booriae TaxID=1552123 RepID=A0A841XV10_9LIST|nr:hypothetical protein [Listeria booriae]MBC1316606.1 hypothetical protein [Listeria booriae]